MEYKVDLGYWSSKPRYVVNQNPGGFLGWIFGWRYTASFDTEQAAHAAVDAWKAHERKS